MQSLCLGSGLPSFPIECFPRMDFSSKLALTLVQSQDWLLLHRDKGEIRGLLQSLGGGLVTKCFYWQCGKMQPVDDTFVGTCGVSFSCTELLFLMTAPQKGMWGWDPDLCTGGAALLGAPFPPIVWDVLGGTRLGSFSVFVNQPLGTKKLHFKNLQWLLEATSASVQWLWAQLCYSGANPLLMEGPGGQKASSCFYWLYIKYISFYCKADKILRGFLYLQAQLSRLNIT